MAFSYKIHEHAHKEYIAAYEWYETQRIGLGATFMRAVENRLTQISNHPEYYSRLHGNFRQVKVEDFPFIIVFEFFPRLGYIHIAAIYHIKRNPQLKYRTRK